MTARPSPVARRRRAIAAPRPVRRVSSYFRFPIVVSFGLRLAPKPELWKVYNRLRSLRMIGEAEKHVSRLAERLLPTMSGRSSGRIEIAITGRPY